MSPTRRSYLRALSAGLAAAQLSAQVSSKADSSKLAMPGLYRGRVIAVANPASIVSGKFQEEPIRQMIRRGMASLTGTDGGADAWRQFFEPGDVVGVKVNPVGQPHVISSPEVIREIIAGLNSAGVKAKEIVVYDRYRKQFFGAGFDKWLPEGGANVARRRRLRGDPACDRRLRPGSLHGYGADAATTWAI